MDAKLTVLISEELRRKAKIAVAQRGETLSDIVRAALTAYVAETERIESDPRHALEADPLFLLSFSGGPGDVVERVDEILMDAVTTDEGFRIEP